MRLQGIVLRAGVPTVNGRVYHPHMLLGAVERFQAKLGSTVGTVGWMRGSGPEVTLDKVTHRVLDCQLDSRGILRAQVEVLDTPQGRLLTQSIEEGKLPSFSLTSVGTLDEEDIHLVKDLEIETVDLWYDDRPEADKVSILPEAT